MIHVLFFELPPWLQPQSLEEKGLKDSGYYHENKGLEFTIANLIRFFKFHDDHSRSLFSWTIKQYDLEENVLNLRVGS